MSGVDFKSNTVIKVMLGIKILSFTLVPSLTGCPQTHRDSSHRTTKRTESEPTFRSSFSLTSSLKFC